MKKKALCIGNASYPIKPLKNPVNDARAVSSRLTELGFSCQVLLDANHLTMDSALKDLSGELYVF